MDDPAGVCCLDAGLNATFAQPSKPVKGLVIDGEWVDLLPVAAGVSDCGFGQNRGHVRADVGHGGAVAEQAFEFVGEFEASVRQIQGVVEQIAAMAVQPI